MKWPRVSAPWLRSRPLARVFEALTQRGAEARVVGGAVRNTLLHRPVREIDLATTAPPDEVMALAKDAGLGAYPTGIEHGTVTIVTDGEHFEVTTLRRDVQTDGRRAVVTYTKSWTEDAGRRDFTINALYCAADGTIYDPVGGIDDIRWQRVRFIGDAQTRIREDFLRILRFFRFSAEYGGGHLDPVGLSAAIALKQGLSLLSAERIRSELMKLLVASASVDVVHAMHKAGILPLVVRTRTETDRFARLAEIEAALGEPPDAQTRLAALAVVEPDDAELLSEQLRLSNAETSQIAAATAGISEIDPNAPKNAARAALYKLGASAFSRAVRLAWARSSKPANDPHWRALALLPDRWKAPTMPFSGSDVLALGVAPGPKVGTILRAFEDWWIKNNFPEDAESQGKALKELAAKALT